MKDDLTPEQKERLQQQDEFLGDVKSAMDDGKKKVKNYREYPAPKNKLDADMQKSDQQEFDYQMKKSGVSHSIVKKTMVKDDGEPQGRLMKIMKKVKRKPVMKNNAEGKAREENVDVNKLEKIYQQNRQDLNDENVPDMSNPKYQSPKSDQYKNPVNEAIKTGGIKVKKILGN